MQYAADDTMRNEDTSLAMICEFCKHFLALQWMTHVPILPQSIRLPIPPVFASSHEILHVSVVVLLKSQ